MGEVLREEGHACAFPAQRLARSSSHFLGCRYLYFRHFNQMKLHFNGSNRILRLSPLILLYVRQCLRVRLHFCRLVDETKTCRRLRHFDGPENGMASGMWDARYVGCGRWDVDS